MRNINGPEWVKDKAEGEGWVVKEEKVVVPPKGLQDGRWEVSNILSEGVQKKMQELVKRNEGLEGVLKGMRGAVVGALEVVEGGVMGVETMNVWIGKLDKGQRLQGG